MPTPLWEPPPELVERAAMTRFMREHGFEDYASLWRWSVDDLEGFWGALWRFFAVGEAPSTVLASRAMPGAEWFPGTRLNYAAHLFRDRDPGQTAIVHASELRGQAEWSWGDLRERTAAIAGGLRALGVGPGDRVAAYVPNVPDAVAAFLASASVGAIWSSCSPDFGARSVIDRFAQIEPKVLIAVDGYRYNGRDFDRSETVAEVAAAVGGRLVRLGHLDGSGWEEGFLVAVRADVRAGAVRPSAVGPLLVGHDRAAEGDRAGPGRDPARASQEAAPARGRAHRRPAVLVHHDRLDDVELPRLRPAHRRGDRALRRQPRAPGHGRAVGSRRERRHHHVRHQRLLHRGLHEGGVEPAAGRDLSRLRAVGSTGSPLSPEGFRWVYEHVGRDTWLFSTSGGTDLCTAFVGGCPLLPVYEGELQARALGADVQAWDPEGRPLIGEVGELVIAQPMPSMPLYLWNDPDGERLHESYFSTYPGIWRHGDWIEITERGTAVIHGRSDSTINRGGVRMGTAEIYRAVLAVDAVLDALVVDVDGYMPLFVVLRDGVALDDALVARIRTRIREDCSPRHVPNDVIAVPEVPRTLSGKVLELPVKRILMGTPPDEAASRDSLANPASLDLFVSLRRGA